MKSMLEASMPKPANTMKMYVFRPDGHGQHSFFVVAKNKQAASNKVHRYIKERYIEMDGSYSYESQGWGTDYFCVEEYDVENVAENRND